MSREENVIKYYVINLKMLSEPVGRFGMWKEKD